jgi:hypothetical protein
MLCLFQVHTVQFCLLCDRILSKDYISAAAFSGLSADNILSAHPVHRIVEM